MTSPKKLEANRRNALKSTGPRTPAGKARSSRNGARHGLYAVDPALPGLERRETWEAHREGVLRSLAPDGYLEEVLSERVAFLLWRLRRVARYEREAVLASWKRAEDVPSFHAVAGGTSLLSPEDYRSAREEAAQDLRFLESLAGLPEDARLDREDAASAFWAVHHEADERVETEGFSVSVPGLPDGEDDFDAFDAWTAGLFRVAVETYAGAVGSSPEVFYRETLDALRYKRDTAERNEKKAFEARQAERHERLLLKGELVDKVTKYETTVERSLFRTLHELQRLQAARAGGPVLAPVAVDVDVETDAGGLTLEAEVVPAPAE